MARIVRNSRRHLGARATGTPTSLDQLTPWKLSSSDINFLRTKKTPKQTVNAYKFFCGKPNRGSRVRSRPWWNEGGVTQFFSRSCAFNARAPTGPGAPCHQFGVSATDTSYINDYYDGNDCGLGGHAHEPSITVASYGWHTCGYGSDPSYALTENPSSATGCGHNSGGGPDNGLLFVR